MVYGLNTKLLYIEFYSHFRMEKIIFIEFDIFNLLNVVKYRLALTKFKCIIKICKIKHSTIVFSRNYDAMGNFLGNYSHVK